MVSNRQVFLKNDPQGNLKEEDFDIRVEACPAPAAGQVLLRVTHLSLDPLLAFIINNDSDITARIAPGHTMGGWGMCEVVDANGTDLPVGTVCWEWCGWQDYLVVDAAAVIPLGRDCPVTHHLGIYGVTGLAAYHGMVVKGQVKAGETVVVSAAAGATGTIAALLARSRGARVVGITSSAEKGKFLLDHGIADAVVSHRSETFEADLQAACPNGVDVYFDSVGGKVLAAAYALMNVLGRIVVCGAITSYSGAAPEPMPYVDSVTILVKRLSIMGIRIFDELAAWPEWRAEMRRLLEQGRLEAIEDVFEGLEQAPRGLIRLLAGETIGKAIVRL